MYHIFIWYLEYKAHRIVLQCLCSVSLEFKFSWRTRDAVSFLVLFFLFHFFFPFFFCQAKRKVSTGVITQVLTVIFDEWKSSERRQISHSKSAMPVMRFIDFTSLSPHQREKKSLLYWSKAKWKKKKILIREKILYKFFPFSH